MLELGNRTPEKSESFSIDNVNKDGKNANIENPDVNVNKNLIAEPNKVSDATEKTHTEEIPQTSSSSSPKSEDIKTEASSKGSTEATNST